MVTVVTVDEIGIKNEGDHPEDPWIRYKVVACTSEDGLCPGKALEVNAGSMNEDLMGWTTLRNCSWPQRVEVEFPTCFRIEKVKIRVHSYRIPKSVAIYVTGRKTKQGPYLVGRVSFDSNLINDYQSSEEKLVDVHVYGTGVILEVDGCHHNHKNIFEQATIVDFICIGEEAPLLIEETPVPIPERHEIGLGLQGLSAFDTIQAIDKKHTLLRGNPTKNEKQKRRRGYEVVDDRGWTSHPDFEHGTLTDVDLALLSAGVSMDLISASASACRVGHRTARIIEQLDGFVEQLRALKKGDTSPRSSRLIDTIERTREIILDLGIKLTRINKERLDKITQKDFKNAEIVGKHCVALQSRIDEKAQMVFDAFSAHIRELGATPPIPAIIQQQQQQQQQKASSKKLLQSSNQNDDNEDKDEENQDYLDYLELQLKNDSEEDEYLLKDEDDSEMKQEQDIEEKFKEWDETWARVPEENGQAEEKKQEELNVVPSHRSTHKTKQQDESNAEEFKVQDDEETMEQDHEESKEQDHDQVEAVGEREEKQEDELEEEKEERKKQQQSEVHDPVQSTPREGLEQKLDETYTEQGEGKAEEESKNGNESKQVEETQEATEEEEEETEEELDPNLKWQDVELDLDSPDILALRMKHYLKEHSLGKPRLRGLEWEKREKLHFGFGPYVTACLDPRQGTDIQMAALKVITSVIPELVDAHRVTPDVGVDLFARLFQLDTPLEVVKECLVLIQSWFVIGQFTQDQVIEPIVKYLCAFAELDHEKYQLAEDILREWSQEGSFFDPLVVVSHIADHDTTTMKVLNFIEELLGTCKEQSNYSDQQKQALEKAKTHFAKPNIKQKEPAMINKISTILEAKFNGLPTLGNESKGPLIDSNVVLPTETFQKSKSTIAKENEKKKKSGVCVIS